MVSLSLLTPNWPTVPHVRAYSTTRIGGVSAAPYASLNLGQHVGDLTEHVAQNRRIIQKTTGLPGEPCWLQQVHSAQVLTLTDKLPTDYRADAAYTTTRQVPCIVMTADCLPVLFCSMNGDEVAAAHAGWRGLCEGILENTLAQFTTPKHKILAWLGPAIGPQYFEVGSEVRLQFIQRQPQASQAFKPIGNSYLADIYQLARLRLWALGLEQIYGGEYCTYSQADQFFSYRREQTTGRMASMIWLS